MLADETRVLAALEPMVRRTAARFALDDDEDALQEARIRVLLAVRRFDPQVPEHLVGYAWMYAWSGLSKISHRYRRQPPRLDFRGGNPDAEVVVEIHSQLSRLREREPRTALVVERLLGGETQQEVAASIGTSRARVGQLAQRGVRLLQRPALPSPASVWRPTSGICRESVLALLTKHGELTARSIARRLGESRGTRRATAILRSLCRANQVEVARTGHDGAFVYRLRGAR
jgi:RNA polymerase sigma factor (sigma-70 family)